MRIVTTSELKDNDVVVTHGMRVRLVKVVKVEGHPAGDVWASVGEVLTPLEEVRAAGIVPVSWLDSDRFAFPEWTIQGTDSIRWRVED